MKSHRSEREMGKRTRAACSFPVAVRAHLVQGLLLPQSWRLPGISHQKQIQFPYSFLLSLALQQEKPFLLLPVWQQDAHYVSVSHLMWKILNQPTSHTHSVDARHRCQLGQTAWSGPGLLHVPEPGLPICKHGPLIELGGAGAATPQPGRRGAVLPVPISRQKPLRSNANTSLLCFQVFPSAHKSYDIRSSHFSLTFSTG